MKRKPVYTALLLTAFLLPLAFYPIAAQSNTVVYVNPKISIARLGENFSVSINIANVTQLYAYQFWLQWDSNLLDLVQISEGPFLNSSGAYNSFFVPKVMASDTIYVAATLMSAPRTGAPSGGGTLATISFSVKAEGTCALHFLNEPPLRISMLINFDQEIISHTTEDGYFIDMDSLYNAFPQLKDYDELQANYTKLRGDYISLKSSYDSLDNNYKDLQASYNSLQTTYNSLNSTYNSLIAGYSSLQTEYNNLNAQRDSLNQTYNEYKQTHPYTDTQYNDLKSEYNTLTNELGTTRNLSYIFVIATIIFIATTAYFIVRKSKIKPE